MLAPGVAPAPATIDGRCEPTVEGINAGKVEVTGQDAVPVVGENPVTGDVLAPSGSQTFEVDFHSMGYGCGSADFEFWEDPDSGGGGGSFELPACLLFRYAGGLHEVHACGPLATPGGRRSAVARTDFGADP